MNNIYRGVLQNFPRGSVWTLVLQVGGSGFVLQLARAKLHRRNQMMSCAEAVMREKEDAKHKEEEEKEGHKRMSNNRQSERSVNS